MALRLELKQFRERHFRFSQTEDFDEP